MKVATIISDNGIEEVVKSETSFTNDFIESQINSNFNEFEFNEKILFYNNLGQIGSEFNQKATQICNDFLEVGFPIFGKVLIIKKQDYEK